VVVGGGGEEGVVVAGAADFDVVPVAGGVLAAVAWVVSLLAFA
jgi:hypothetical protein